MGRLVYSSNISLDGYVSDAEGSFEWSEPDVAVHEHIADLIRDFGTHLYGRRMYDVMSFWETTDDPEPAMRDFARIWRGADKIVFSTTLTDVVSERTRIERAFAPDAVRDLVLASDRDVLIGGADLAGQALALGLIDELHAYTYPVVLGGGVRWLPEAVRVRLELLDVHRFDSGVTRLQYRVAR